MRISDWSSDVCSSDLTAAADAVNLGQLDAAVGAIPVDSNNTGGFAAPSATGDNSLAVGNGAEASGERSEEHTSELQSLMRISYAVFCLKKKNKTNNKKREEYYVKQHTKET